MTGKTALITGIVGQDGSYMAELLLEKGYNVHGIVRRSSNFNTQRIEHIFKKVTLHYGDVTDMGNMVSIISRVRPDEIYNLAAMSHVKVSFELENYTFQTNTMGVLNILQAVKLLNMTSTKVYQASTSEMFGNVTDGQHKLNESSNMLPVSPYGIAKLAAHHLCQYYRSAYGMFIVSSVLLNHESERRGPTFVTKKIADYVGRLYAHRISGSTSLAPLSLGNLDAKRDWGYARDYVEGIYMMMQHDQPDDYTLATGSTHSVREFVELAFGHVGVNVVWEGEGVHERGIDASTGQVVVVVDKKYYRPIDIEALVGDYSKAHNTLGWQPKTSFPELVRIMTDDACRRHSSGV